MSEGVDAAVPTMHEGGVRMVFALAVAGCTGTVPPLAPQGQPPDLVLYGVRVDRFRGDAKELTATTPELRFHRQGERAGQLWASTVVADVSAHGFTVAAGQIDGNAYAGVLEGADVVVITDGGATLRSARASFERDVGAQGTAATDAGLTVAHPAFRLSAASARYDLAQARGVLTDVEWVGQLAGAPR